jgi:hypothetical protein
MVNSLICVERQIVLWTCTLYVIETYEGAKYVPVHRKVDRYVDSINRKMVECLFM